MFLDVSTELLLSGYGIRFRPSGQSMTPTIRDGEAVTVEPIKARDVRRGEIILYRTKRGLFAHRIVRIVETEAGERTFYLRGDASDDCDAPVSEQQILGKIVVVERNGRRANLSVSKSSAWFKGLRRVAKFKSRFC